MPIDSNLLNKIRAVIALRDKGATDGERDAAQQRLTVLLAKHKLTEQDIPPENFSTRGRQRPHSHPRQRPRQRRHASDFDAAFEETLRRFREAAEAQRASAQRSGATPPPHERRRQQAPKKRPKGRVRFEGVFGELITDTAWQLVKTAQTKGVRKDAPPNAAAYARAFYESAAIELRTRVHGTHHRRAKSTNAAGIKAGTDFGLTVDTSLFTYPNES